MSDVAGTDSVSSELPPMPIIQGLYETHLTVSDLTTSVDFYRDVVGLELAIVLPERACAFFGSMTRTTACSVCGRQEPRPWR